MLSAHHTHTHKFSHTRTYTHTHTHQYTHTNTHTHTQMHKHKHTRAHTLTHANTQAQTHNPDLNSDQSIELCDVTSCRETQSKLRLGFSSEAFNKCDQTFSEDETLLIIFCKCDVHVQDK